MFGINGSDATHKIKLLAMELNPTIPGLEIKSKPKSTKKRLAGSTLSMPIPPNKKKLAKIDAPLLKIDIPCVPVSMKRCIKGEIRVIGAQSRKFSLADIRRSILNRHERFMRLHTDDQISAMGKHRDIITDPKIAIKWRMIINPQKVYRIMERRNIIKSFF